MRLLFISSLVFDSAAADIDYSIAGNNFQKKVVKSLSPYKTFSLNFWNKKAEIIRRGDTSFYLFPINKIKRVIYLVKFTKGILLNVNKLSDVLIFYNIDSRNILVYLICKFLKGLKCYVIVADCNLTSKSVLQKISKFSLSRANGILALSKQIQINPNSAYQELLLEEDLFFSHDSLNEGDPKNILMSGSLGETTGLRIALGAMHYLKDYHLHLCGPLFDIDTSTFEKWMREAPNNITYYGILDEGDYLKLLKSCSICLSLRKSADKEHLYNFPSKIGEYLYYKKQVVSTIQYEGFESYLNYCEWDELSLTNSITNLEIKTIKPGRLISEFGFDAFRSKIELLVTESYLNNSSIKN